MTDKANAEPISRDTNGWDDLTEDVIGLNLRGIRTVWDIFVRPAAVFSAARTSDWRKTYTPSLRLFFSLIALLLLFKFFWAGEDAFLTNSFEQLFIEIDKSDPEAFADSVMSMKEMARLSLDRYLVIYPFTIALFFIVVSLLTFVWGKGTSTTTRIRLFFAALIPNATLTIPITLATTGMPAAWGIALTVASVLIVFLIDSATVWRGLKNTFSGAGRFWRSFLFAVITFTTMLTANTTAQLLAAGWTGYEAGHATALAEIEAEAEMLRNALPDDSLLTEPVEEPDTP